MSVKVTDGEEKNLLSFSALTYSKNKTFKYSNLLVLLSPLFAQETLRINSLRIRRISQGYNYKININYAFFIKIVNYIIYYNNIYKAWIISIIR